MCAFTKAWSETDPAGTENASLGDDRIRDFKYGIRERLAVDHNFLATEGASTTIGNHIKAGLIEQSSDPSTTADMGLLYTKDVSGVTELFYRGSDGNVIQLSTAGKINGAALALTSVNLTTMVTGVLPAANGGTGSASGVITTHYRSEMLCSKADSTTVRVGPGVLDVNGTKIAKTANTDLAVSTDANWAEGAKPGAWACYAWLYVDASGNIKLGASTPDKADGAGNTVGILRYKTISAILYRCVGWCYIAAGPAIADNGVSNFSEFGIANILRAIGTTDITTDSITYVDMTDMSINFFSVGGSVTVMWNAPLAGPNYGVCFNITIDGTQKIAGRTATQPPLDPDEQASLLYNEKLAVGTHTIKVQWRGYSGTGSVQQGATIGARILVVEER